MSGRTPSCRVFTAVALIVAMAVIAPEAEAAPAFFVFGDSLVDKFINNNYLTTPARADSPPYGIDFPTHRPTGRFSNGLNFPDITSEQIGSERVLPYLSSELRGQKLLIGANFASAGIGILNDTGFNLIFRQFELFQQYQQRLTALVGAEQATRLVNSALVPITLGGNDWVNNYFVQPVSPNYGSWRNCYRLCIHHINNPSCRSKYKLYELGARRVLVTSTGPLGCVPSELAQRSINSECVAKLQNAASIFNPQLVQMTQGLNRQLTFESNVFASSLTSFVTSKVACCGQGRLNGLGQCNPTSNLCPNRDLYAFWDAFHPTEKANRLIVKQIMSGSSKYMNPMNLSTMMS
ncbi:GDSL esterase/lipase LTL1-like [Pyrus ussuriensis x Pyrus communis]|uniref:GDSL esterase/lipase LTL1-like n=1 Tax=Pyrus ussuriensis x Pyrus communis TaxID=2448454 RepID=A0A5N5IFV9_9ROSA|nr:GDSL esterase/lipase LTL1-like [Pyrus ussuriensis x Pyrus communis]